MFPYILIKLNNIYYLLVLRCSKTTVWSNETQMAMSTSTSLWVPGREYWTNLKCTACEYREFAFICSQIVRYICWVSVRIYKIYNESLEMHNTALYGYDNCMSVCLEQTRSGNHKNPVQYSRRPEWYTEAKPCYLTVTQHQLADGTFPSLSSWGKRRERDWMIPPFPLLSCYFPWWGK